jgi:mono/diheme cytochrome c family protein
MDLLEGRLRPGNVHGLDLDWDGQKVLFAYAKAASDQPPDGWLSRQATFELHRTVGLLHLYEMGIDGTGLRQLTDGEWSDLNPCYLPDGDIAFESERCAFEINCNEMDKDEPTTNLFAMRPGGSDIRRLAVTKDGDWYPRVLHDGSIVYSHWEYHERSLAYMHPLWSVLPDGTGADAFAKQHFDFPVTLTAPRPIPGSPKVMAVGTGHHTLAAGPLVIVDRSVGPNDPACLTRITGPDVWPEYGGLAPGPNRPGWHLPPGEGWYMDPYPLSETVYLASYCDGPMQDERGYGLYLVDVYGGKELLYRDPAISSVMPVPIRPRPRPPVLPSVRAPGKDDATCVVTNVTEGVPELQPGEVKRLRVAEVVPWAYSNDIGGRRYEPDAKSMGVTWTPIRILGTVPVQPDGSAYFRVPAGTELYFQALDENGMELRRMRTYLSFQPGETRSCVGCHETRAEAPPTLAHAPLALSRPPATPTPPPWGDRPLSFLRDVQPVLTKNCARCHTGLKPEGGVDLSPGLTGDHNRAYDTLLDPARGLLATASKGDTSRVTPVRELGSHASRLVKLLQTTHQARVSLTSEDWERLYTWVDANALYYDNFIIKRPAEAAGYSLPADTDLWNQIGAVHQRRCAACHADAQLARPDWVDLDDPARSLFVTAPLAGATTPTGKKCSPAVYQPGDADCTKVEELLKAAVDKAWQQPRRDLRCLAEDQEARRRLWFADASR